MLMAISVFFCCGITKQNTVMQCIQAKRSIAKKELIFYMMTHWTSPVFCFQADILSSFSIKWLNARSQLGTWRWKLFRYIIQNVILVILIFYYPQCSFVLPQMSLAPFSLLSAKDTFLSLVSLFEYTSLSTSFINPNWISLSDKELQHKRHKSKSKPVIPP